MSVGRQFIDTNILVYAYDTTAGAKQEQARRLLRQLWQQGTGCMSVQILQEFHNVVTRRISRPLSSGQSSTVIRSYSVWRVHSPNVNDVVAAIELQARYQTSFWDALVLHSATQLGCEVLWSEDLSDGQFYGHVRVSNPFS